MSFAGRRRVSSTALVAIAAAVGVMALALGSWAFFTMADDMDASQQTVASNGPMDEAATLLANPSTERIPFAGSAGKLTFVVGDAGEAFLVLKGLPVEPAGKSYQAWVVGASGKPVSAAVFSASSRVVALELRVPRGATVAITVEPEGGAPAPSSTPKLIAQRT